MDDTDFLLRGPHITLDALIKATGAAGTGGAAKQMIVAGEVRVDGEVETRRGAKIRAGQRVQVAGRVIRLQPAEAAADPT
jgi:ribosome-associated protein